MDRRGGGSGGRGGGNRGRGQGQGRGYYEQGQGRGGGRGGPQMGGGRGGAQTPQQWGNQPRGGSGQFRGSPYNQSAGQNYPVSQNPGRGGTWVNQPVQRGGFGTGWARPAQQQPQQEVVHRPPPPPPQSSGISSHLSFLLLRVYVLLRYVLLQFDLALMSYSVNDVCDSK